MGSIKKGKPAKPSVFTIDQEDIASWYDTPIDFGGQDLWHTANSVTLCKGKTASATSCDPIWTGYSKDVFKLEMNGDNYDITMPSKSMTVDSKKVIVVKG